MPKNEAELESLISQVLKTVFPTFNTVGIQHQRTFSVNFGHHIVTVDLKDPGKYATRSIFDILLTVDDRPIILLELKRQGHALTEKDREQGLSYARLIHPMPPLTLISNGEINEFYNTYSKALIDVETVDIGFLQNLIDNSFAIALNDFKDAVNILLNRDYTFFSNIINSSSRAKFELKGGRIEQFEKVICNEFIIEREINEEIESLFKKGNSCVGISGEAFSGKTSLLFQLFKRIENSKDFGFYIDCYDYSLSILQQLALDLSASSKLYINIDKVREFFTNSLSEKNRFYLLIDNFNKDIPDKVMEGILELMHLFETSGHRIVFTADEYNLKKLVKVKNRNYYTYFGETSIILKLADLTLTEYNNAKTIMLDSFRIDISHGGHNASEYRKPRILRHLAAAYRHGMDRSFVYKIDSVPNQTVLNLICKNPAYPKELHEFSKNLSLCFRKEHFARKKDAELGTIAFGSGAVMAGTYDKNFGKGLKKILKSGFVVQRYLPNQTIVLYPKFPELVAIYAVDPLVEKLLKMQKNGKTVKEIVADFIDFLTSYPEVDIIGAMVLQKLAADGEFTLFLSLVHELLEMPPQKTEVVDELHALTYIKDRETHLELKIKNTSENSEDLIVEENVIETDGEESGLGSFINNFLPYPILSQLASQIFIIDDEQMNENSLRAHQNLIAKVGSYPHFIMRPDALAESGMIKVTYHEIDGGEVYCHKEGIVEAITQSIQLCYLQSCEYIENVFYDALKQNNTFLLWRIFQALTPFLQSADPDLRKHSSAIITDFMNSRDDLPIC